MDLPGFSGRLPLFPLPNIVLFPGQYLPLHIFEPRYRAMVADALGGEKYVGMALWFEGRTPDIAPVVGMGRIVHYQPIPDGRSNIVLQGVARARVDEEIPGRPYRLGRVTLLKDETPPAYLPPVETARESLMRIMAGLIERMPPEPRKTVSQMLAGAPGLGEVTDLICGLVEMDAATKQLLLEQPNGLKRADVLLALFRQAGSDPFDIFKAATTRRGLRPPESTN
jgi:Lon protease-like protein